MSRTILWTAIAMMLLSIGWLGYAQETRRGVATGDDHNKDAALLLAARQYFRQYGTQMDARVGMTASKFLIGYDSGSFAHAGDEIWEVKYAMAGGGLNAVPDTVEAVFWVNPASKDVLFISGMGEKDNLFRRQARQLVSDWYEKNVGKLDANMTLTTTELFLDYPIPDFAKPGAAIVEVRLYAGSNLHGIFWVSPTHIIRPLAGPWLTPQSTPASTRPATAPARPDAQDPRPHLPAGAVVAAAAIIR